MLQGLVTEAGSLVASDDPAALFTLLSRMIVTGAENGAVKSALAAAEFDLRTSAPQVAADLTHHVAVLLERAHAAGAARPDTTVGEVMAVVAGAFTALQHAGVEPGSPAAAHLAGVVVDGLRPPAS